MKPRGTVDKSDLHERKEEPARSLAQGKAAEERLAKEYALIAVLSGGVPKHIGNGAA